MSDSVTPWTVAHQAPLSMEFSRQEYQSGLPFLSPGNLPNPGIEPASLAPFALQADSLPSEPLGKSQESSPAPQFKRINSLALRLLYGPTLTSIHDYWKNHSLTLQTFVGKVMSLIFNMLSRFVIALLPRRKCLNFMAAVIIHGDIGAQENKICPCVWRSLIAVSGYPSTVPALFFYWLKAQIFFFIGFFGKYGSTFCFKGLNINYKFRIFNRVNSLVVCTGMPSTGCLTSLIILPSHHPHQIKELIFYSFPVFTVLIMHQEVLFQEFPCIIQLHQPCRIDSTAIPHLTDGGN